MINPKEIILILNKIVDFDLREKSKKREVVFARYVFFEHIRNNTKYSVERIGRLLNVSHSTVSFGLQRIEEIHNDYIFKEIKQQLNKKLCNTV